MESIVIAGGNSFIARHFIDKIDMDRYRIIAFVRDLSKAGKKAGVRYAELDMENYSQLPEMIDACDYFIPFAWNGCKRCDLQDENKNQFSYRVLRDVISKVLEKYDCKKVLLPGSHYEYENVGTPIDENTKPESGLAYGKYKYRLWSDLCEIAQKYDSECVDLRFFSVYGKDDSKDKMLNSLIIKLMQNDDIELTECRQMWSFLHVNDAVDAIISVMENENTKQAYNISSNNHMQLREFVEEAKEIVKSQSRIIYGAIPYKDRIPHTVFLSGKLRQDIGWRQNISFEEGIREIIKYYENERPECRVPG